MEPILSPEIKEKLEVAISRYKFRNQWEEWGLNDLKENGNTVLLHGPPGTGKTVCARWMALQLGNSMMRLNVDKLGSATPGQSERNVRDFFAKARKKGSPTLFLDEADDILADREQISESTWKVGMIEAVLLELNTYKGLVICATNYKHKIDSAMFSRFISTIEISLPDEKERLRMWKEWLPNQTPHNLKDKDFANLANVPIAGRSIINALVNACSLAIHKRQSEVSYADVMKAAKEQLKQSKQE